MRKHAVEFYSELFRAVPCDVDSAAELLEGLSQLSPDHLRGTDQGGVADGVRKGPGSGWITF